MLIVFLCFCKVSFAQQPDSIKPVKVDLIVKSIKPDTTVPVNQPIIKDTSAIKDSTGSVLIDTTQTIINNSKTSVDSTKPNTSILQSSKLLLIPKIFKGKEFLFYLLIGMLVFYGALRLLFPKYFTDLFRVYFRTTLKQSQVKEQLVQNPLPSFFLNGFFALTGGLYASFLLQHFNLTTHLGFWEIWLYCSFLLAIIYIVKFAGVTIAGWLFSKREAASSYIFIIFMTNKILGIIVLPFLVLLAFGSEKLYSTSIILSLTAISCIFLYRAYLSIGVVRGQIRINPLHFLLYLLAFEIIPLLVMFKLVMNFLK